ncbi:MAG: hypothetical protein JSW34_05885 [Candidatus Zixiibacteriota bacterium]|nr:MAG: hypothetical protein JSW34_05885 [candidate division Zixibacteria bacterium]
MKRITAILIVLIVGAIINSSCTQGTKTVTLRFKYEPGTILYYEQLSKSHKKVMENDSVVREASHTYTVDIVMEVKGFTDDTTAEVFEKATWEFIEPNKEDTTKLDTTEKVQEILFKTLPNGKIVNFEFTEKEDPIRYQLLKNYYEQGLPVFPDGEKPVGYNWTQSTRVLLPGETMEASTTYQIKSLVRESGYDCAVIEYTGNLILPILPNPKDSLQKSGIERIQSNGLLYFAYKEGLVVLQKENWSIEGDMQRIKGDKKEPFKILSEYDVTYALKKKETGG